MDKFREDLIRQHLRLLSSGLLQNKGEDIYSNHRTLVKIGSAAIPFIEEELLKCSWSKVKYGTQLKLLTGLLSLSHDIDEHASRNIAQKIKKFSCSPIVKSRIKSILAFSTNNFKTYKVNNIMVYQSKSLQHMNRIKKIIIKWMEVIPKEDIHEVKRIYVTPESTENHRGDYMPILYNITLEWIHPVAFYHPYSWYYRLNIEHTLYHEVGHHVCKHVFGQDPEQEKEANDYAKKMMGKNHPVFKSIVSTIRKLFRNSN